MGAPKNELRDKKWADRISTIRQECQFGILPKTDLRWNPVNDSVDTRADSAER